MKSKKRNRWLLIIILGITVSSCTPAYFMANTGMNPIVFTKPVSRDTAIVTDYIGGEFSHSIDSAYQWHTIEVLESGTVIFEVKQGFYASVKLENML